MAEEKEIEVVGVAELLSEILEELRKLTKFLSGKAVEKTKSEETEKEETEKEEDFWDAEGWEE